MTRQPWTIGRPNDIGQVEGVQERRRVDDNIDGQRSSNNTDDTYSLSSLLWSRLLRQSGPHETAVIF